MHAATRCLYWRSYFTATVTAGLRSCCAVAADYCALAQEYLKVPFEEVLQR